MKTKFKLLRPDEVWHPKRGGRPGNRNALKTGQHTAKNRALRRQVNAFIRRARAIAAMVEAQAKAREPDLRLKRGGRRADAPEPSPVARLPQAVGFLQRNAKSRSVSGAFP